MAEYGYVPRFSWRDWFKVTTSYPYWDQWFEKMGLCVSYARILSKAF